MNLNIEIESIIADKTYKEQLCSGKVHFFRTKIWIFFYTFCRIVGLGSQWKT